MVRKKVDDRVKHLIEHGVKAGHRSLLVIVGDHGKDQVVNLHQILSRCQVKARPSVLWCYKKELGFSTHRKKRMRQIKKAIQRGLHDPDKDDPFDLFMSSVNIRWCYYKETHRVLGQTFGMCVLQDFEAVTPNLLARTVETVEGGGLVIILLRTVASLKQLYTMTMDVHARFRTEAHDDVVARFNERFILSLGDCDSCLVLDDELNVLPLSQKSRSLGMTPGAGSERNGGEEGEDGATKEDKELMEVKESVSEIQLVGSLVALAKTTDQARAVLVFLEAVQEKTLRSTLSLTASRGRGKSAAVGLCLAGAIAYGYSNIFVTAPSPENLTTVFDFVKRGLDALHYKEHMDYEMLYSGPGSHSQDNNHDRTARSVVKVQVFRSHRQVIQYIMPHEHDKVAQAELLAIDEAAAIPLPVVKSLLGPYLVFMSSTINGYEGTGRSLSLKLVSQLREQQGKLGNTRKLREVTLETPIRYARGDPVEAWLHALLCLDAQIASHKLDPGNLPPAEDCHLYYVDRDTLFSYHKASESFLQRLMALYTAAHYKNQPNDLQLMSDAPAHQLYALLKPQQAGEKLPEVLCVIQVALEGQISQSSLQVSLSRGHRASGDLIPWTVSQHFLDADFARLSGMRVVRIATHPEAQGRGYGTRAMNLLIQHFQGELAAAATVPSSSCLKMKTSGKSHREEEEEEGDSIGESGEDENALLRERLSPRVELPPLLTDVKDRPASPLHWMGVSFGMTENLMAFWHKASFRLVYLRQTANDLTGEHTAILLRRLDSRGHGLLEGPANSKWLEDFTSDALRRLVSLLSFEFRTLSTALELAMLDNLRGALPESRPRLTAQQQSFLLTGRDLQRLHLYSKNLVDYHLIRDLLPTLARLYFLRLLPPELAPRLSHLMEAILVGMGLQHKPVEALARELGLPVEQVLAMFNKAIRKLGGALQQVHDSGRSQGSAKVDAMNDVEGGGVEKIGKSKHTEEEVETEPSPGVRKVEKKKHKRAREEGREGEEKGAGGSCRPEHEPLKKKKASKYKNLK